VGLLAQRLRDEEANYGVDAGESSGSVGGTGLGGGSLAGIGAASALAAALRCSAVRATHRTGAAAVATTVAPRTPNTSMSLSIGLGGGSLSTTSLSAPASTATAATGHKVGILSSPHTSFPFSTLPSSPSPLPLAAQ
jgi:hypothetical protein